MRKELETYTDIMQQVRFLSAVQIPRECDAAEYRDELTRHYGSISELGARSRMIMETVISPVLKADAPLNYETIVEYQEFCDRLLNPTSGDELDLSLLFELSKKLLNTLTGSAHHDLLARQLHMHISVCYANMNRTTRITASKEQCGYYREEGLRAAEMLKEYLGHDLFLGLSGSARHAVLRGIRFYSALYDTFYTDEDSNRLRFQALKDAVALYHDAFYIENTPGYDWNTHLLRCYEHMGQLTERGNRWGFTHEQCEEIFTFQQKLDELWHALGPGAAEILPQVHLELLLLRNSYFAGNIDLQTYRAGLLNLYDTRSNSQYDMYSVQANLLIPAEYMVTLDPAHISAAQTHIIHQIYDRVIAYIAASVNMDAFNYLQEYLMAILENYIEIPGEISYRAMGLRCLAALHVPTYVHSLQVACIARCIAQALLRTDPEIFADYLQSYDGDSLLSEIYRAGLCHDFGKLTAIDTIFVYGRDLLESEYNIIRLHPLMGADMLSRFSSTRRYSEPALMHHVWFDGSDGYPGVSGRRPGIIASVITIADCIDTATDAVGRSYSRGKALSDIITELKAGSGTRYNPAVVDILNDPELLEDLEYYMQKGRTEAYTKAFRLLKSRLVPNS